jgi:hypothetical protein
MDDRPPRVACDFDGVIHSFVSGWVEGSIPDPPVDGAIEWLEETSKECEIIIFSARLQDRECLPKVKQYLLDNGLSAEALARLDFKPKPGATIYLDDRAWQFTGRNFPTIEEVKDFKPWNKVTEVLDGRDFFDDLKEVFSDDGGFW